MRAGHTRRGYAWLGRPHARGSSAVGAEPASLPDLTRIPLAALLARPVLAEVVRRVREQQEREAYAAHGSSPVGHT